MLNENVPLSFNHKQFHCIMSLHCIIALRHLRESVEVEFHLAYENKNNVQYKMLEREYEIRVYRTMVIKYTWYVFKYRISQNPKLFMYILTHIILVQLESAIIN
jgi:hypothetical protein